MQSSFYGIPLGIGISVYMNSFSMCKYIMPCPIPLQTRPTSKRSQRDSQSYGPYVLTSRDIIWTPNNEVHGTHGVDFARACSRLTYVFEWLENLLSAFVGVTCNNTREGALSAL